MICDLNFVSVTIKTKMKKIYTNFHFFFMTTLVNIFKKAFDNNNNCNDKLNWKKLIETKQVIIHQKNNDS